MKIAFFTYPSAFQNVGGGEMQLLKTKEYLERAGTTVHFFDPWKDKIEDYDILHVFSSVKDCLGLVEVAKARGVKVAISPVLWTDLRRAVFTDGSFKTKAEFVARHLTKVLFPSWPSARRKLLVLSDLVFPNSEMEKEQIARLFAVPRERIKVVYNGVDPEFLAPDPSLFRAKYGNEPFILGVGRVEPRKNQLNLIRAVKKIGRQRLILIGSPVSGYENYFAKCQKEGIGFATFIPTLENKDPLLKSAYGACGLFVLQGWFETPGLAALEAALAGAKIIVTKGGSTREYFEDHVDYVDPSSPEDIAQKIVKNLAIERNGFLKDHVLNNFTWEKTIKKLVGLYKEMLR